MKSLLAAGLAACLLGPAGALAEQVTVDTAGGPVDVQSDPGTVAVFDMAAGEARAVRGDGAALIVRLDDVTPVNMEDPQIQQLGNALRDQAAGSVSQDLFRALNADIQSRAGISIDQSAVNSVLSTLQ